MRREADALHVFYLEEFEGFEAFLVSCGFLLTGSDKVYTVTAGDAVLSPLAEEVKSKVLIFR